jgi:hypothetical protein
MIFVNFFLLVVKFAMQSNVIHQVYDPLTSKSYEWLDGENDVSVGDYHGSHSLIYEMFGMRTVFHDIDDPSISFFIEAGRNKINENPS